MSRLHDKVAIITGAGQGIGEAIARRFSTEGARVIGIDRNAEAIEAVCGSLPQGQAFALDVTDHEALASCIKKVTSQHNHIDILVNNAGVSPYVLVSEMDTDTWRRTLAVNLEAYFVACRLVAGHMMARKSGRIVNIASTQAIASEPLVGAYAASKGGILAFTRTLAVEMAPHGVLVNAIAPGCIHTPMSIINGVDETESELFKEWYVRQRKIPLGRPGEPEEVASCALFLSSDDCRYVTGHTLVVDGGLTITF